MIKTFEQFVNENYSPDDVNGARAIGLSNYKGLFFLKKIHDSKKGEYYIVYYSPTRTPQDVKMVGEYNPTISINDDHKNDFKEFNMWLEQNFDQTAI
jgi:hypothetical protein